MHKNVFAKFVLISMLFGVVTGELGVPWLWNVYHLWLSTASLFSALLIYVEEGSIQGDSVSMFIYSIWTLLPRLEL